MTVDPRNIRYGDVSEHIKSELEGARLDLETAAAEDVPALQGRISALRTVIGWFEHGAIARAEIFNSTPNHET